MNSTTEKTTSEGLSELFFSLPAPLSLGIDIGSTTAKAVLLKHGKIVYSCYERHFAQVRQKALELVKRLKDLIGNNPVHIAVSGSAGLGLAKAADLPFVQEVYATSEAVRTLAPDTSTVIELGGEDAKVIFLDGGIDERMNGTCAGGTGAFIDQMATLLDLPNDEMDELSLRYKRLYPIASRCGVFAKTDIQPLLNQGASKEDIAASIYQAVVDQTIAGLAQGRKIGGKVLFLGGPLSFCKGLRNRFRETLRLSEENGVCPPYACISVAIGAAIYASRQQKAPTYDKLVASLEGALTQTVETASLPMLFENEDEYGLFRERHAKATVPFVDPASYTGDAYLGIDCGSTTTKLVLMNDKNEILHTYYSSNKGNPVLVVKEQLERLYEICGDRIRIRGSAVTGYGEALIKNAFHIDRGLVETIAHFTAAAHFNPKVDFILDIGGQDIKCFRIKNGAIDSILLNEACSSGCGSFIETFAKSMGYDIDRFSKLGLFASRPVDLGSRCTVFMNSSVKQAQKDGATVEDISAGLSISVVKNAIYKVIRATSPEELGENVVVQGGTFYNDAVLRSFENTLGRPVVRPTIAGLMGAYGAALYARSKVKADRPSTLITREALASFTHTSKAVVCKGCTNHCNMTVNTFSDGSRFISGNRCEKGAGKVLSPEETLPNLHEYKRGRFAALAEEGMSELPNARGVIGLPLALGNYELAPFWTALFRALRYNVRLSGFSDRRIYAKGQYSIPSDTACYPAKIMHGHIETLIEQDVTAIFYPSLSYNVNEEKGDNHYNCPVVAYYSELLKGNMDSLSGKRFLYPYLNINDKKELLRELLPYLQANLDSSITKSELKTAIGAAYRAYDAHMTDIRRTGEEALAYAKERGKRVMILAGRPYHIDPEIGHGIDKLATALGFVVVTEDSVSHLTDAPKVNVLNQWTYHARLYSAAKYATEHPGVELVQLVSFGCGIDAVTTDETRAILESAGRLYTQIKIDEITNLGAVNIRLRSLLGALEQ
ncbi:MAG: 2-hydroxyacyl-CoA dehydratase [Clostridia bacterium]|nr:2-hydroxyacyl-CoA dehydratase [Clostridia bacterium]MBR2908498.1 2-hydroxyacyl-CoA dehydratase [Clostridia bacterium]